VAAFDAFRSEEVFPGAGEEDTTGFGFARGKQILPVILVVLASGTQTAYAASTISAGSWTAVGAATIHEAIDEESPGDADYAQSNQSPASASAVRIKFGSLTDPATAAGHTVSYRVAKDYAGGDTIQVTAKLYQGGTLISTDPSTRTLSETFTTYEWALSGAEADAISDYTDLRLDISAIKV
jgi:hypothetical protein